MDRGVSTLRSASVSVYNIGLLNKPPECDIIGIPHRVRRLVPDQHRIGNNEVEVLEVVLVELEFSPDGDEVIHLESAGIAGKVDFGDRLRPTTPAEETLTHRKFRQDNVVALSRGKGYVKAFEHHFPALEFPDVVRKHRVIQIFTQLLIEFRFKLRTGKQVPGVHALCNGDGT